jgi:hypothetical protein
MNIRSIHSPRWSAGGAAIDVVLVLESGAELPFTARPDDPEEHGREIFARAARGEFGPVADALPVPEPSAAERARSIERSMAGAGALADRAARDIAIAALPATHPVRRKAEAIERAIVEAGIRAPEP